MTKEPHSITKEQQEELLFEIVQLVKEFYGGADFLTIRIANHNSDINSTRKVETEDDPAVISASLTISETKSVSSGAQSYPSHRAKP